MYIHRIYSVASDYLKSTSLTSCLNCSVNMPKTSTVLHRQWVSQRGRGIAVFTIIVLANLCVMSLHLADLDSILGLYPSSFILAMQVIFFIKGWAYRKKGVNIERLDNHELECKGRSLYLPSSYEKKLQLVVGSRDLPNMRFAEYEYLSLARTW